LCYSLIIVAFRNTVMRNVEILYYIQCVREMMHFVTVVTICITMTPAAITGRQSAR